MTKNWPVTNLGHFDQSRVLRWFKVLEDEKRKKQQDDKQEFKDNTTKQVVALEQMQFILNPNILVNLQNYNIFY